MSVDYFGNRLQRVAYFLIASLSFGRRQAEDEIFAYDSSNRLLSTDAMFMLLNFPGDAVTFWMGQFTPGDDMKGFFDSVNRYVDRNYFAVKKDGQDALKLFREKIEQMTAEGKTECTSENLNEIRDLLYQPDMLKLIFQLTREGREAAQQMVFTSERAALRIPLRHDRRQP